MYFCRPESFQTYHDTSAIVQVCKCQARRFSYWGDNRVHCARGQSQQSSVNNNTGGGEELPPERPVERVVRVITRSWDEDNIPHTFTSCMFRCHRPVQIDQLSRTWR